MSLQSVVLLGARKYVSKIPEVDRGSILRSIEALERNAEGVDTKQLRGVVRELIVGHHRLTYFKFGSTLYFIRGFRKKTTKTPNQEIEYAVEIYKRVTKLHRP